MKKMMHYGKLLALAGLVGIVSAEAGGSAYFYRRTMMRYNAKTERTMKMSGVDWEQYFSKIADCPFTSPKAVFTHVLHSMYHLPAFPIIQIADAVNKKQAGYGLDECNSAREVRKAKVPVLLIHGDADTFVPCSMSEEIYKNCKSPKQKLIIHGAGHCESYYKDREAYEGAMDSFIGGIIE